MISLVSFDLCSSQSFAAVYGAKLVFIEHKLRKACGGIFYLFITIYLFIYYNLMAYLQEKEEEKKKLP